MAKVLKPYTIIPPDLYVRREADKQVANIIKDMGRPGYVLVSRQMGKTNLLLNAKRNLESQSNIFVYVDLSNSFKDAKSCFENIIDVAVENFADKFNEVSKIIKDRRKELKDTPPHKQHTNELRLLLNSLEGGKMIIILDEIDALTKTDYSDQIFSQIRSSYFASRVNYKEFYNLTYLLSGVVEPGEIIKDPKISPFNIGQKIYLNDFTRDEFNSFVKSSKLELSENLIDRIYYWANGNPRISWDICSEVENVLARNGIVQNSDIDVIVHDLYLTTFDKPPIDNIRELVKSDREIRNSISEIEYNKGKQISDRLKNKLYLAGIINYFDDDVKIKNEIIKRSLSNEWVRMLDEEDRGLIGVAMEEYQSHKYGEALATFERFLKDNDFPDDPNVPHYYYIMGHSAYSVKDFEKALKYFNKADFDPDDESIWFYKVMHQKAMTYYHLNRSEEGLEWLKKIIDFGKKDALYARALLNYGSISLKSDVEGHKDNAVRIFNEIINETAFKKEKIKDVLVKELKSIAYYNLGQVFSLSKERDKAISSYKFAIDLSKDSSKPRLILALLKVLEDKSTKDLYFGQLVDLIQNGLIRPIEDDIEKPMDFSFDELRDAILLAYVEYGDSLFHRLMPSLSQLDDKPLAKHLFDLALFSINFNNDWVKAKFILNSIRDNFGNPQYNIEDETRYATLKLLSYVSSAKTSFDIYSEYIDLFQSTQHEKVDFLDLEIFANSIFRLTEEKNYSKALEYVSIINSVRESTLVDYQINYLVIFHLELNLYLYLSDSKKAYAKAVQIIGMTSDPELKNQTSNLLGDTETGIELIRQNAQSVLDKMNKSAPKRIEKPLGRNEFVKVRYKDGTIILAKYKKIKNDIESGNCFILN